MKMLMLATTAAMIEQFNKNNILILESMGYEVHVAGNFKEGNPISDERLDAFKNWINERHGKWFDIPSTRSPFDFNGNGKALKRVIELIKEYHYEFIHCHSPLGSVIGRIAAHKTHTKIIYTAHGFHFYDGAPLKNWLLYYPVERFLSRWTDVLITINKEDFQRASCKFHAKRTVYVPGIGVDTERFSPSRSGRDKIRKELRLDDNSVMLLSVGELNENKNHSSVIKAISGMNLVYVVVGKGDKGSELESLAKECNVDLRLTGFRSDVSEFYNAADVYVLPSYREGLNVSLMEAMASGLPAICGKIRGNIDLIEDNDYLFDPKNVDSIKSAIQKVLSADRKQLGNANLNTVKKYDTSTVKQIITELYKSI